MTTDDRKKNAETIIKSIIRSSLVESGVFQHYTSEEITNRVVDNVYERLLENEWVFRELFGMKSSLDEDWER